MLPSPKVNEVSLSSLPAMRRRGGHVPDGHRELVGDVLAGATALCRPPPSCANHRLPGDDRDLFDRRDCHADDLHPISLSPGAVLFVRHPNSVSARLAPAHRSDLRRPETKRWSLNLKPFLCSLVTRVLPRNLSLRGSRLVHAEPLQAGSNVLFR